MYVIKNTSTGDVGEPFNGPKIFWPNGDQGYLPEAGMIRGDYKIYAYSEVYNGTKYDDKGVGSALFDDLENTCVKTFAIVPKSLDEVKTIHKDDLAAKRYEVEVGGVIVGGMNVNTQRDSQAMIAGAKQSLDAALISAPISWKAESGFVSIDGAALNAIAGAVATHVQACFSNEASKYGAINTAATIAEVLSVDINAGWPS